MRASDSGLPCRIHSRMVISQQRTQKRKKDTAHYTVRVCLGVQVFPVSLWGDGVDRYDAKSPTSLKPFDFKSFAHIETKRRCHSKHPL